MKTIKVLLTVFLFLLFSVVVIPAQQMPQDYWWCDGGNKTPTKDFIPGRFQSVAIGPDGNVYLGTNGTAISVWTTGGTTNCSFVRQFGNCSKICGIAVDSQTNVYVMDHVGNSPFVRKYSSTGSLINQWGGIGTNDFQFGSNGGGSYTEIAVDSTDRLIVADSGNNRVLIYNTNDSLFSKWGTFGNLPGQLNYPNVVAPLPNGQIFLRNGATALCQVFDIYGNHSLSGGVNAGDFAITPDGFLVSQADTAHWDWIELRNPLKAEGGSFSLVSSSPNLSGTFGNYAIFGIAFDKAGRMYSIPDYDTAKAIGLYISQRKYSPDLPLAINVVPQPIVQAISQRTNSPVVDIDFSVLDRDNTNVQVACLAFINGGANLSSAIALSLFVENTFTNLGTNIAANLSHRISWDATESITNFSNLQFEILAKDGRGLLGLRFITVPATQSQTNFAMTSAPIGNTDFLNMWFWLIATHDPAISFTNGVIKGLGGSYNLATLASGATTTSQGRAFLYERLNVRAPTASEITQAQAGSYGFISISVNNAVKLP